MGLRGSLVFGAVVMLVLALIGVLETWHQTLHLKTDKGGTLGCKAGVRPTFFEPAANKRERFFDAISEACEQKKLSSSK